MNMNTESRGHRQHEHPRRAYHRHFGVGYRAARGEGRRPKGMFRRRFFSRDERIAGLEQYLNDLRAEAQAVEEKLARLRTAD